MQYPIYFKFPPQLLKPAKERREIIKHLPFSERQEDTASDLQAPEMQDDTTASDLQFPELQEAINRPGSSFHMSLALRGTLEDVYLKLPQRMAIRKSKTKQELRLKIKLLQQKLQRLNKRINNLEDILNIAKKICGMQEETLLC